MKITTTPDSFIVEHDESFACCSLADLKRMHTDRDASILSGVTRWQQTSPTTARVTCVERIGPVKVTADVDVEDHGQSIRFRSDAMHGEWRFSLADDGRWRVHLTHEIQRTGWTRWLPIRRLVRRRIAHAFDEIRARCG